MLAGGGWRQAPLTLGGARSNLGLVNRARTRPAPPIECHLSRRPASHPECDRAVWDTARSAKPAHAEIYLTMLDAFGKAGVLSDRLVAGTDVL